MRRKSLVIGASAGLGRNLSEELAKLGHDLFLISSGKEDLEAMKTDLCLRFNVNVYSAVYDLSKFDIFNLHSDVTTRLGTPQNIFLIAGVSDIDKDSGTLENELIDKLIMVNFHSPITIINSFLETLAKTKNSNVVAVGSVASQKARSKNMVYGAAKSGLEQYVSAIRHWLARNGSTKVQYYRLGFMNTSMVFGQSLPLPAIDPSKVSRIIIQNLDKDLGAVYLPKWWFFIIALLQVIPWKIFKKLDI